MSDKYIKTVWKDQNVENPRTYNMQQNEDGTTTVLDAFGEVVELGTPVNAENMNKIENELERLGDVTYVPVFSVNEASKDASGNPNFMSVSGEQIVFNGAVKYTQANGESKEYASVSPIALASGYVMLNNGVAEVVPALEVQQSEPMYKWEQPILTTNGIFGDGELTCRSSNEGSQPAWKAFNGVNDITNCWATGMNPGSGVTFDYCIREGFGVVKNTITNLVRASAAVYAIKDFSVSRSTDGVNWVVEHELLTNPSGESGASFTFDLNQGLGRYVRYTIINGYETLHYDIGNIEIEAYDIVTNQTIWFNPYNNQAKQYNGTDWVDYNGVPVGTVTDGIVYNYQYNTQKGLNPTTASASPEEKAEIASWGVPDYGAGVSFQINIENVASFDGAIVISDNMAGGVCTLEIDGVSVGQIGGESAQRWGLNGVFPISKGSIFSYSRATGGFAGQQIFMICPFKGVI